jgi:hypothetical protein
VKNRLADDDLILCAFKSILRKIQTDYGAYGLIKAAECGFLSSTWL